ncbi:uncharacterized protein LOC123865423 [Maniola jurtina]|uniref:uncharacterized protein LOC123865423 n=1 Tax=Maniola jurtina TaxID=191418 RepID=UPI001E68E02E|nr:uncharacterized protein LOC123865423 [Maniola jurtina]
MGSSCSFNDKWCDLVLRLEKSAEARRKRRRGCTCINRRPKCLRIRRKKRNKKCCNGKCSCPSNGTEVQIPLNIDTIACCSPRAHSNSKYTNKVQPKTNLCSRGTNTCCLQNHDREIQGANESKHVCGPTQDIGKNICRFTVDAYFM